MSVARVLSHRENPDKLGRRVGERGSIMAVLRVLPPGSRPARSQGSWVRAVDAHPDVALLRADANRNLHALVWELARWADWETLTSRPTWERLGRAAGLSRSTVAKWLAWLRGRDLLAIVQHGTTPLLRPGVLYNGTEGNLASVYVLCEPSGRDEPSKTPKTVRTRSFLWMKVRPFLGNLPQQLAKSHARARTATDRRAAETQQQPPVSPLTATMAAYRNHATTEMQRRGRMLLDAQRPPGTSVAVSSIAGDEHAFARSDGSVVDVTSAATLVWVEVLSESDLRAGDARLVGSRRRRWLFEHGVLSLWAVPDVFGAITLTVLYPDGTVSSWASLQTAEVVVRAPRGEIRFGVDLARLEEAAHTAGDK